MNPLVPDKDEVVRKWKEVVCEAGVFQADSPVYYSERGEQVRSKSEVLIANKYYHLGVPYRYENPIELNAVGKRVIFRPDFTVLNLITCNEVYHEHFGLMDDPRIG